MDDEKMFELPALGRPMQLGMLYDCRDDTLIPGITMWDPDVLKNDRDTRTQQGTQFNIVASDSINDKSRALNIEASLKASLMAGLVDVRGSAEIMNDQKSTSHKSRLTLQYKTTVRFEQLTMKHLGRHNVQYPYVFEHGIGTHVVTGILYGAQAFLVFDRYLGQDESEQQVKGYMSALIKKIPCFNMDGEGDLKLTESEKEEAEKFHCKFYGDIATQSNPQSYQEALALYTRLPSLLGESGENAVPLTVLLYPLSKLDNKAAKLVREISMNAIGHVQDIFEGLDQWKVKCDDLEKCNICTDFPKLKEKLDQFRKLILEYKRALQQTIARALPKVRGGEAEEKILLDIISDCEQSPFNMRQLERWVTCRKKEINILGAFMKGFGSPRIIRSREDLDVLLLDFSIEHTVAFSFSAVGLDDDYLKALARYIRSQAPEPFSPQGEWFDSVATSKHMRIKAKQFKEFATANKESEKTTFAVMGFDDGENATVGGSIFLYENGVLTTKDFHPPGAPGKPEVLEKFHDSVILKWAEPKDGLSCVDAYLVRYRNISSTQDDRWSEYRTEGPAISASIPNLRPNTTYEFSVAASCEIRVSQVSKNSDAATTLPCSPPGKPEVLEKFHDSVILKWAEPQVCLSCVDAYLVRYRDISSTQDDRWSEYRTEGPAISASIPNLRPNTTYEFSVAASCEIGVSQVSKNSDAATTLPCSPPGKPEVLEKFHDSVILKWAEPQVCLSCVDAYLVRYRDISSTQDDRWSEYRTEGPTIRATIHNLKPNTTYEFSVAASCEIGVSQVSQVSNAATTLPSSPPYDVKTCNVSKESITVAWKRPNAIGDGLNVTSYIISSIAADDTNPDNAVMSETEGDVCLCTVEDLQPDTWYRISVSAGFGTAGGSAFSEPIEITTVPAIDLRSKKFEELISQCEYIKKGDPYIGEPSIYKLPLVRGKRPPQCKYQTYFFENGKIQGKRHLVVMVVGATGAGKSTLINGMINYIFDVDWNDNFRFKIIAEEGENQKDGQAQSQTQLITSYTIYPSEWSHLEYRLTIVDTPGFGDTRGIDRDKAIVDQIRNFFSDSSLHHVDHIDVIGFVTQASQARLTHTQRYVFDSVLAIFGKDIEQNISLLVTFADGQKPPVLDSIRAAKIPCSNNMFKFNNSALFANRTSVEPGNTDECFDKMFWKMGVQSMQNFFFSMSKIQPRSLTLTQEVLKERERLETAVEGLQPQIQMGCAKLDELQEEQRILEQHEADIDANKNFVYQVDVQKSRKKDVPHGEFITNCSRCHFTCHYPCAIADDKEKAGCAAMTDDGTCSVCPGRCIWDVHFNQAYRFEFYSEKEKRTYADLESRYNDATGKKLTVVQVIKKHQEEFVTVQKCVCRLIEESHRSLKRLEEIALRPNPLSALDYVDLMIESEKREGKPGWKARVKALEDVRKGAEIVTKIKEAKYVPFQEYQTSFVGKGNKAKGPWAKLCSFLSALGSGNQ